MKSVFTISALYLLLSGFLSANAESAYYYYLNYGESRSVFVSNTEAALPTLRVCNESNMLDDVILTLEDKRRESPVKLNLAHGKCIHVQGYAITLTAPVQSSDATSQSEAANIPAFRIRTVWVN